MSKNTPLRAVHERLGASFTEFGGWNMPVRYASDIAEHHAVRKAAGLFDLCHMGEIEIVGPEAAAVLDYALVGKLSAIAVGKAKYSMMCDATGGIIDDLVTYRLADDHFMVVANASNAEVVLQAFQERAESFDAEVRDARDEWALIAVQGPTSPDIVATLTDFPLAGLKYYAGEPCLLAGADVLLARTGYTGEDGFEIYCRPGDAIRIWEELEKAGEPHGLRPAGLACRNTLRLEAGMPLYGHELNTTLSPFEAGLGRVVAFNKEGPFVGREALAARLESGTHRQLVGLVTDSRRAPRAGNAVLDTSGQTVGVITSGAPSPTLGHAIALAYVSTSLTAPGTALSVDIRGTRADAEVVALPFYSRNKKLN
ncbi:glycine cleavage system aminomethyltransferase GcvT [Dactylosporangium fulvum]|uniref:Aminomethyltransferase n=1 Tax=Dactylosporangium fulvum TaxID=53359 RepID=A0ABY5W8L5_9ACTN|nr:glycine cleavage system aminomethyltransferase GcvT [Dactylosporangium fulvum]UWP86437.1 glycine cleavage system aminomethyltransferase GcvT [Dactylosporangium fulvum]